MNGERGEMVQGVLRCECSSGGVGGFDGGVCYPPSACCRVAVPDGGILVLDEPVGFDVIGQFGGFGAAPAFQLYACSLKCVSHDHINGSVARAGFIPSSAL